MQLYYTQRDPSGYLHIFGHNILPGLFHNQAVMTVAVVVVAIYLPAALPDLLPSLYAAAGPAATGILNGAITGFVTGAMSSGTMKGAFQGAFTGAAFAAAGDYINNKGAFLSSTTPALGQGSLGAIAIHGVVGCVTSAASGGKCSTGAMSAGFSEAASPWAEAANKATGTAIAGLVVSSVVGGTASRLGGGKFSNGATTAAYGYLFNRFIHLATDARAMYGKDAGPGHHWVPFGSTTDLDISDDARQVWGLATNGVDLPSSVHRWDPDHAAYNAAVRDELLNFAQTRGIDLAQMSADEAREFLGTVKTSNNPAISRLPESVASPGQTLTLRVSA